MPEKKESYSKGFLLFYLQPRWESILTTPYFIVFVYFSVYHFNNLAIAYNFITHTLKTASSLLELTHLFWGVLFVVTLILPFTLSFTGVFFPHEVWRRSWNTERKILIVALLIITTIFSIAVLDDLFKVVAHQDVLRDFVIKNELRVGKTIFL